MLPPAERTPPAQKIEGLASELRSHDEKSLLPYEIIAPFLVVSSSMTGKGGDYS
jgi:hypothetical protein